MNKGALLAGLALLLTLPRLGAESPDAPQILYAGDFSSPQTDGWELSPGVDSGEGWFAAGG